MVNFLRRLIARFKRRSGEEFDGTDMADAKQYAQSRDLSPPPPGSGIP